MFGSLLRLIGAITVKEKDGVIHVDGVPADVIARDIAKIWETSRVNTYLFNKMGKNSFSFNSFFAIEVLYILEQLRINRRSLTNVRAIDSIIKALKEETWLAEWLHHDEGYVSRLDLKALSKINGKLLPKQMEFLESYSQNVDRLKLRGYLLAADPGTGKSLTSLALSLCAHSDTVVVVCPKTARHRPWEAELHKWLKPGFTYWISGDNVAYNHKAKYQIVHYNALGDYLLATKDKDLGKVTIILDESHNLNEIVSLQTQTFLDLCIQLKAIDVLWQSGTPIKAMGSEMIPMLRCIDPLFTRDTEERFKKIFGKSAQRANNICAHRLGQIKFVIRKDEVYDGKPNFYRINVSIPNGKDYTLSTIRNEMAAFIEERMRFYRSRRDEYSAFYDKCLTLHSDTLSTRYEKDNFHLYKSYIAEIKRGYDPKTMKAEAKYCNSYELKTIIPSLPLEMRKEFKDIRTIIKYVELKVQGEALGRVLGKKRAMCYSDMVKHIDFSSIIDKSIKKTLVFTSYVDTLKAAQDALAEDGYKTVAVWQETNNNLPSIIKAFETDPNLNPLLATFKSLSTAVPMLMANTIILIDKPWRQYILDQTIARVSRYGQDTEVDIFECMLDTGKEPNISTRGEEIIQWSKEQVAAIMGIDISDVADVQEYSLECLGIEPDLTHVGLEDNNRRDWLDFYHFDESTVVPKVGLETPSYRW